LLPRAKHGGPGQIGCFPSLDLPLRAITALPFVISTGAQRSGEICGSAVHSWKCFRSFTSIPHQAGGEKAVARVKPGEGAQKIAGREPLCRTRVEDTFTL
jgi:hypothetical protein